MILGRIGATGVVLAAAVSVAGCGDSSSGSTNGATPVIATTTIWADVASNVACGAEIASLIPAGADPHTFEPSLRDRETLDGADTVIANGLGLEASLTPMLETTDATVVEMSDHVDVLPIAGVDHAAEEPSADDDAHDHGDGDPHIWQDPLRVAGTIDTIATALAANGIDTCTDEYRSELEALDAELGQILDVVPADGRVLVTSHDSMEYFADRYDFEVVGTVIPSTSTLAETNAAELGALADLIESLGVPAIFTDALESSTDADALARRLGVEIVPLVTGSLGDEPPTDTYAGMMRHNATLIAETLAP